MDLSSVVLTNLKNPILKVEFGPTSGASLCIKEAVVLALSTDMTVECINDSKIYIIKPQKILADVMKTQEVQLK